MKNKIVTGLKNLDRQKYALFQLIKRDIQLTYTSSYFGTVWILIQPIALTLVLALVFSEGFKFMPVSQTPFVPWFLCALASWNFFSSCVSENLQVVHGHKYLLEKIEFDLKLLPLIKITANLIVYTTTLFLVMAICWFYDTGISIHWIQIPAIIMLQTIFVLGVSWIVCSLSVFLKDLKHLVSIFLQIGFFATPVLWPPDFFDNPLVRILIALNPMAYFVGALRDSLLFKRWVVANFSDGAMAFSICLFLFWAGIYIFNKLKPHFSDVL